MSPPDVAGSFSSPEELLGSFQYERLLNEDSRALVLYILGTAVPSRTGVRCPAILKVEKTAYDPAHLPALATLAAWEKLEMITNNDIYSTILAWYAPGARKADVQLSSICPASEKHIKKYSQQTSQLIRETPALYKSVVVPYLDSLPTGQINWVYNILDGLAETENVLHRDLDPETGFVLTPDLKWDQQTMSALYLLVLVQTRKIRLLRDLRPCHLPLLHKIRQDSEAAAMQKYGIRAGQLRFFVHYQPTYYHFHVHVTHISYVGFPGITVGQAHLLDDIIDNLELETLRADSSASSYYESRTLTYSLGTEHALFAGLSAKGEI